MELIEAYGGSHNLFFLGAFCFFIGLICFSIKSSSLRIIISLIAALFLALQLASLYATNTFVGYGFYVHFNLRNNGLLGLFIPQIIFIFCIGTLYFLICIGSRSFWKKYISKRISQKLLIITGTLATVPLLFIGLWKSSFIEDSNTLFAALSSSNSSESFKETLQRNGIHNYATPNEIKAKPGKNIIIISLESFEKGFLHEKFKTTTPFLQSLKKDWYYRDIQPNLGSNWTSGALYTSLTGIPAFFGVEHNTIFQNTYHSEITSISHVSKKAGYRNIFLNGDANFSGTKDMLFCLEFDKIIDKTNTNISNLSKFGIRDYDLFQLAKKEVETQEKENHPFLLYISLTDTHFPKGHYDERLAPFVKEKQHSLEFMLAGVDYLVKDFIQFLKDRNALENTAVYIMPDHLMMGSRVELKNTGKAGLYLISNTDITSTENNQESYQIDLPKIILKGSEVQNNMTFFSDVIQGDKQLFIKNNIPQITEINTSGLKRLEERTFYADSISNKYSEYIKDPSRYIAHAGGAIDGITYTNSLEALDVSYSKGFKLFEIDITKTSDGHWVANHDWKSWKTKTNYKGPIPPTLEDFENHLIHNKYTPMNMDNINEWFKNHPDAILVTDKIDEPAAFSKLFIEKSRLMMEVFSERAINEALEAGIKVLPTHHFVANLTEDEVEEWAKKGIYGAAISRNFIQKHKPILMALKRHGIKVYAYHINYIDLFDEDYVTKYEMDYLYGIYADNWNFKDSLQL